MNIVDSSLWIEYFLGNDIDQSVIDAIKDTNNLYIPVISLYTVSFMLPPYCGMLNYTRRTNILKTWIAFIISQNNKLFLAQK